MLFLRENNKKFKKYFENTPNQPLLQNHSIHYDGKSFMIYPRNNDEGNLELFKEMMKCVFVNIEKESLTYTFFGFHKNNKNNILFLQKKIFKNNKEFCLLTSLNVLELGDCMGVIKEEFFKGMNEEYVPLLRI